MLKKTPTGYNCPHCGREYDNDEDLFSGGPCPSDDCPSNCEEDDDGDWVDACDPYDIEYSN